MQNELAWGRQTGAGDDKDINLVCAQNKIQKAAHKLSALIRREERELSLYNSNTLMLYKISRFPFVITVSMGIVSMLCIHGKNAHYKGKALEFFVP